MNTPLALALPPMVASNNCIAFIIHNYHTAGYTAYCIVFSIPAIYLIIVIFIILWKSIQYVSLNIYFHNWFLYNDFLENDIIELLESLIIEARYEYLILKDININLLD